MLADKFGLRPWEIRRLTSKDIHEMYLHPRDKHGNIKFPVEEVVKPKTYEGELAEIMSLEKDGLSQEMIDIAVGKLREKYHPSEDNAGRRQDDTRQPSGGIG